RRRAPRAAGLAAGRGAGRDARARRRRVLDRRPRRGRLHGEGDGRHPARLVRHARPPAGQVAVPGRLLVIVPTLNERENLPSLAAAIFAAPVGADLLVVDDASPDCTGGFQVIRRAALERIGVGHIRTNGYSFLVELKYRIFRSGGSMVEVPIVFTQRRHGRTKMTRREIFLSLVNVWKLRLGLYRR